MTRFFAIALVVCSLAAPGNVSAYYTDPPMDSVPDEVPPHTIGMCPERNGSAAFWIAVAAFWFGFFCGGAGRR